MRDADGPEVPEPPIARRGRLGERFLPSVPTQRAPWDEPEPEDLQDLGEPTDDAGLDPGDEGR
ncbi:hypothetical protein [Cellulomonas hominis]